MEDKKRVLVAGDIMIDNYVYVTSNRIASEAKIPVWDVVKQERRLGGAANVAHNLKILGVNDVEVYLSGIVDERDRKIIENIGINTILCSSGSTMRKDRFVDDNMKYVLRCDNFKSFDQNRIDVFKRMLSFFLSAEIHKFDAIIFSDYDKGTLNAQIVDLIVKSCSPGFIVVDSKRLDLSMFKGSLVLKINEFEYSRQVSKAPYVNVESLFTNVVVTKGKDGAELRQMLKSIKDSHKNVVSANDERYITLTENFPSLSVATSDVTGCGDTHTAAMTFSLLAHDDLRMAIRFANECSRKVVQKFGTSVPT
jgi:D-beta-D-heptose 7-phosphate kinase/D-beta-D-heptose 1-phosphate adenosyltransferase